MTTRAAHWLRSSDAWVYLSAAASSMATAGVALQLWKADLAVPLTYRGDALPVGAHFKTVFEQGWYEFQPNLGAPWGQTYNDFPTADNLHLIAAKVLGLFTSDWAVAMNAYFLIGFPLIAMAAVWFLRTCGISPLLTIALSTLYAIAPYHFIRGESHLWLASYYAIPLALTLLVLVLRGEPLWGPAANRGILRWLLSPTLRTLLVVAILATSSSYYSVFFLALLAPAGIFVLIRDRDWGRFWGAAAAGGTTVIVMLVNMLPDLIFARAEGQNLLGLERSSGEAELYALKLSQLLLPWSGHRIDVLAQLRQRYDAGYVSLGEQPALGAIGAIGLIAAFLMIGYLTVARMKRSESTPDSRLSLVVGLSGLVFVAFIFSTLGGLSTIISFFTSSLRGWNRMSIVIAALCLAIVGLLIDHALSWWSRREEGRARRVPLLAAVVAVLLVVIGFVDQTPGDSDREYAGNATSFAADATYFGEIQDSLEPGSEVLVLPYVPFPESTAGTGLFASDQLIPYLHTSTIAWSNGGIKGRPTADWSGELEQYGIDEVPVLGAAVGFAGVLIDRRAALDGGAALEAALGSATREAPQLDDSGRFAYYSLASVRDDLEREHDDEWFHAMTAAVTNPVVAYRAPGFDPGKVFGTIATNTGSATFSLVNDAPEVRDAVLSFSALPGSGHVEVTFPDGHRISRDLEPEDVVISYPISVAPGTTFVTVAMFGPDGAPLSEMIITQPRALNVDVVGLLAE